jgi:putative copper export protein
MTVVDALGVPLRWVEYAGLLGFVGVMVVRRLAGNPPALHWARTRMDVALGAALVGGAGLLPVEWIASGHVPAATLVRVAAEAVALVLCRTIGRGAVPAGFAAVLLLAFAGHATQAQPAAPAVFIDALHVLSAGAWAGGIAVVATLHPPGGWAGQEGRDLLRRFGGVAMIAFAFTAVTGLLRATESLVALTDLWTGGYGAVLLAKTAGVLAMLALSAVTLRRGVPAARAQALLAIGVIGASAVLAAMPNFPASA